MLEVCVQILKQRDNLVVIIVEPMILERKREHVRIPVECDVLQRELEAAHPNLRAFFHERNMGKGRALRTGFQQARGDYVIIQDADLEYDPQDYRKLIHPLEDGRADAVYGSRFITTQEHRVLYFWHSLGNQFLTLLSNMMTDLNLTDMETCYKMVKAPQMKSLVLTSDRFGFEPEITARLAQARARIWEIPISYSGRTYEEGKKIGWKDGVAAFWHIVRFNLSRPKRPPA